MQLNGPRWTLSMPGSMNCSSELAKWPFLSLSRASSSAMTIFGAARQQRDVIRERTVRPVVASDSQTRPRFVVLLPITHTPPDRDTIGIEIPIKVKQAIGLDDAPSWVIVSEYNIDEWPNAGLSPVPGKAGRVRLWLPSAWPVRAGQNQIPRIGSTEQERRGAPLIA